MPSVHYTAQSLQLVIVWMESPLSLTLLAPMTPNPLLANFQASPPSLYQNLIQMQVLIQQRLVVLRLKASKSQPLSYWALSSRLTL